MTYERPSVTELGSVADLTQGDRLDWAYDGVIFHKASHGGGGGTPTS